MPDDHTNDHGDSKLDHHGEMAAGEWVSVGEAARRLGVTRAAIYGRIERRTLPTRPKGNRGIEVLLPPGDRHRDNHLDVAADHHGDGHSGVALASRLEELL